MFNQGYSEKVSGFDNSPGKNQVSFRRRRVVRQMIMAQDNTTGVGQDCRFEDFTTGADSHFHNAYGGAIEIDDIVTVIKIEYQDAFRRQIFHVFFQEVQDCIRIGKTGVI